MQAAEWCRCTELRRSTAEPACGVPGPSLRQTSCAITAAGVTIMAAMPLEAVSVRAGSEAAASRLNRRMAAFRRAAKCAITAIERAEVGSGHINRHCERSEAIQRSAPQTLD